MLAVQAEQLHFKSAKMHFFHSVRLSHWRVSLRFTLRKIRSLEIPSGSFLEFRFKISFSRNFSASLVTRLGALRSGFAFTFVLRNFASWILLAVQAEQLHFKSACALFPFRSAFTLAGFAHLRSLHPTPPFAKIFDFVQNGSSWRAKSAVLDFASGSLLLAALLKPSGFSRSAVHSPWRTPFGFTSHPCYAKSAFSTTLSIRPYSRAC